MARQQFELNEEERKRAEEFIEKQKKMSGESGTIYDRFSYEFTPTSIGTYAKIKDNDLGDEKRLTNMSNW